MENLKEVVINLFFLHIVTLTFCRMQQNVTEGRALLRLWPHIPVYAFSYGSFNVAVISSVCPASNGVVIVNNEFEWMCENVS